MNGVEASQKCGGENTAIYSLTVSIWENQSTINVIYYLQLVLKSGYRKNPALQIRST